MASDTFGFKGKVSKGKQKSKRIYPCTGLRAPMLKSVKDCKLLTAVRHQEYKGTVDFRYTM